MMWVTQPVISQLSFINIDGLWLEFWLYFNSELLNARLGLKILSDCFSQRHVLMLSWLAWFTHLASIDRLLWTCPIWLVIFLHSYSTQNQQRPYQKLSEKWLLIISLGGCSLEQKLPSFVTHSPDRTRPGTSFLTSAIPGLRSVLECRNLISSNSFAHRLGTGNSALRLAPGLVGLKPELRHCAKKSPIKLDMFKGACRWKRGVWIKQVKTTSAHAFARSSRTGS
jgi:hypothetical protein